VTKAQAIKPLFDRFDAALRAAGYIAMGGQIVDASLIAAPKQRNTEDEKVAIKGREEALDRVEPGSRYRREMERPSRVTSESSSNIGVLMGGVVVDDGVDPLSHGGPASR
jgi:hypothetical protein